MSSRLLFFVIVCNLGVADEMSLSEIFSGMNGNDLSGQRKIEERIEQDLSKFRSIESSRVVIPVGEVAGAESLWGMSEPRVLNVDVILKLRKRKRLTQNEFHGISDLVSAGLSEKNRVVQVSVRDEEGLDWSEESDETKSLFKAAILEQEISDRLNSQWSKKINWTRIHVSEKDLSCVITGTYLATENREASLTIRQDVMSQLQDVCKTARLNITPMVLQAGASNGESLLVWLERLSFVLIGFAFWGLAMSIRGLRNPIKLGNDVISDEGAIILTKIVDQTPDEAAKWMVRAMLSEPPETVAKGEPEKNGGKPQIFDQS